MSNERAATHAPKTAETYSCLLCGTTTPIPHACPVFAPKTETPLLTERHVGALERATEAVKAPATFTGVRIWTDDALALKEITAVVAALLKREAKLVPTAEIEELEGLAVSAKINSPYPSRQRDKIRALLTIVRRWLTPEDER